MTSLEFNKKWHKYKEEGFSFSQIKFKFNHPRVYISPSSLQEKAFEIERIMAKLYKEYESKKGI